MSIAGKNKRWDEKWDFCLLLEMHNSRLIISDQSPARAGYHLANGFSVAVPRLLINFFIRFNKRRIFKMIADWFSHCERPCAKSYLGQCIVRLTHPTISTRILLTQHSQGAAGRASYLFNCFKITFINYKSVVPVYNIKVFIEYTCKYLFKVLFYCWSRADSMSIQTKEDSDCRLWKLVVLEVLNVLRYF